MELQWLQKEICTWDYFLPFPFLPLFTQKTDHAQWYQRNPTMILIEQLTHTNIQREKEKEKLTVYPSHLACLYVLLTHKKEACLQSGVSVTLCRGTLI